MGYIVGTGNELTGKRSLDLGILFGLLSSATTAIHAIVIKTSMNVCSGTLDLVYYNNLLSTICCLPVIVAAGEFPVFLRMFESLPFESTGQLTGEQLASSSELKNFLIGGFATGLVGFMINVAGFLQIKVTSPVTHMISSAVRGV